MVNAGLPQARDGAAFGAGGAGVVRDVLGALLDVPAVEVFGTLEVTLGALVEGPLAAPSID